MSDLTRRRWMQMTSLALGGSLLDDSQMRSQSQGEVSTPLFKLIAMHDCMVFSGSSIRSGIQENDNWIRRLAHGPGIPTATLPYHETSNSLLPRS